MAKDDKETIQAAKTQSTGAATAKKKKAEQPKQGDAREHVKNQLSDFLSRCGIPFDDITFGECQQLTATAVCRITFNFPTRINDKILSYGRHHSDALPLEKMNFATDSLRAELEHSRDIIDNYAKSLRERTFKDLVYLARRHNELESRTLIGVQPCKLCNGTKRDRCQTCSGSGHVTCPACNGRGDTCKRCKGSGFVVCVSCTGRGKVKCPSCRGNGNNVVDRRVELEAAGLCSYGLEGIERINGLSDLQISVDDEKLLAGAAKYSLDSVEREGLSVKMTFSGACRCLRLPFSIRGCRSVFTYNVIGDSLVAVDKPFIVDEVFAKQIVDLEQHINQTALSLPEKIECCRIVAGKGILARTMRAMDGVSQGVLSAAAERMGVTMQELYNERSISSDPRVRAIYAQTRPLIQRAVAQTLSENAEGFVSPGFASRAADDLMRFLPLLDRINPHSARIWQLVSIVFWAVTITALFFKPGVGTALVFFAGAVCVAAITSFYATKNLVLYGAARNLQLKRRGHSVPDLMPEAIYTGKFLGITAVLEFLVMCFM